MFWSPKLLESELYARERVRKKKLTILRGRLQYIGCHFILEDYWFTRDRNGGDGEGYKCINNILTEEICYYFDDSKGFQVVTSIRKATCTGYVGNSSMSIRSPT